MSKQVTPEQAIAEASTRELVNEIRSRGGHPAALADAILLCMQKSEDYNHGQENIHRVDRSEYFPFGAESYGTMIFTKALRFISLVRRRSTGAHTNFEGLRDTALDIINYAGFYIDSLNSKQVDVLRREMRDFREREGLKPQPKKGDMA